MNILYLLTCLSLYTTYIDIGDPIFIYTGCKAYMWYQKRMEKHKHQSNPKFQLCCGNGKVQLPLFKEPLTVLQKTFISH